MAIGVLMEANLSIDSYDKINDELEKKGERFEGLLFHAAGKTKNGFRVMDVWESEEAFKEFSKTLMPIFKQLNISAEPSIFEIHNTFVGNISETTLPSRFKASKGATATATATPPH